MSVGDARPGDGRIYVQSKGLGRAKQACPASPEALYLGELTQEGMRPGAGEPLWWKGAIRCARCHTPRCGRC